MSRIRVGYLNIAMPAPHSAQRYEDLLRAVLRSRASVPLRADFKGMLGSVHRDAGLLSGQIYKFFDLNLDEAWFNVREQKKAESEDLAKITVPAHLKPHLRTIEYVFFPAKHRMAFMVRDGKSTLSPALAKKLFDGLFASESIQERFGDIAVTAEPSSGRVESILRMPNLYHLTIEITPPNPDDLAGQDEAVRRRLQGINAKSMLVEFTAPRNQNLNPDKEAKVLAKVAASNGKVVGLGRDAQGNHTQLSTVESALVDEEYVDEGVETRQAALINIARQTVAGF